MNIEATAWKVTLDKRSEECKYVIQVDNIDGRSEKKVEKLFEEWNDSGYGWNASTQNMMLRYSRDFGDVKRWLKWAKQFPYKLEEITPSDKRKVLSWGDSRNKDSSKTGRRCGKCGEHGHNARTCGTEKTAKPKATGRKKRIEKGPRKCGKCGSVGHNARTCKG